METTRHTVLLGDELRLVGSGIRQVWARVGRKWVYVKSATAPSPAQFSRVSRAVWNEIVRTTEARQLRTSDATFRLAETGSYRAKPRKAVG